MHYEWPRLSGFLSLDSSKFYKWPFYDLSELGGAGRITLSASFFLFHLQGVSFPFALYLGTACYTCIVQKENDSSHKQGNLSIAELIFFPMKKSILCVELCTIAAIIKVVHVDAFIYLKQFKNVFIFFKSNYSIRNPVHCLRSLLALVLIHKS